MFFNNEQLTVEQRQMYAAEKLVNFRFIAKLLGTRSHHVLTPVCTAHRERLELSFEGSRW